MKTVSQTYGMKSYPGPLMGVEVELEVDKPLPEDVLVNQGLMPAVPQGWKSVVDNSLRGHSKEYVMFPPQDLKITGYNLDKLFDYLSGYKINSKSKRVSTHVHMNVTDMTYTQCINYKMLWWFVEDFLVSWCGPSRVGNNFALRTRDATRIVVNTSKDVKRYFSRVKRENPIFFEYFQINDSKYSALNVTKSYDLGTFEFRSFAGLSADNKQDFMHWLEQLVLLRTKALSYKNPQEISRAIDEQGYLSFAKEILTPFFFNLLTSKTEKEINELFNLGEHFIGVVAYSVSKWDVEEKPKVKKPKPSSTFFLEEENFGDQL